MKSLASENRQVAVPGNLQPKRGDWETREARKKQVPGWMDMYKFSSMCLSLAAVDNNEDMPTVTYHQMVYLLCLTHISNAGVQISLQFHLYAGKL